MIMHVKGKSQEIRKGHLLLRSERLNDVSLMKANEM